MNLDALVKGHKDPSDSFSSCMTSSFGLCKGGELVLYSIGIIIKAEALDWVKFLSSEIVHFVLHYVGQRGSMVLHTDKHGYRWTHGHNGHEGHIMKSAK